MNKNRYKISHLLFFYQLSTQKSIVLFRNKLSKTWILDNFSQTFLDPETWLRVQYLFSLSLIVFLSFLSTHSSLLNSLAIALQFSSYVFLLFVVSSLSTSVVLCYVCLTHFPWRQRKYKNTPKIIWLNFVPSFAVYHSSFLFCRMHL